MSEQADAAGYKALIDQFANETRNGDFIGMCADWDWPKDCG